jgi:hypothetical protein
MLCYDGSGVERVVKKIFRMKGIKVLSIITFIAYGLLVCVTNVNATELSIEEYSNLRLLFSEGRIATLTDEELEKYLSYDFDKILSTNKYYKVVESPYGTTSSEVSELEATMAVNDLNNTVSVQSTYYNTGYKHIEISVSPISGNISEVFLYTEWLTTPKVKSYDVTGFRFYAGTVIDGTQDGTQTYWSSASEGYQFISYAYNGTNIKKLSNGFGISMNLVDAAAYFATDVTANVTATSSLAKAYGSYQHAVTNVTLSQSHDYVINGSGFGGVFNFSSAVGSYYDAMEGVSIELPNTY